MSRHLPAHPNLDHLKKQAKDRLDDLQRHNPVAKLADALHAVALEYGFSSWPTLKAHVASLPPQTDPTVAPFAAQGGGAAVNATEGPAPNDTLSAALPVQDSPFVGHWTADLSRSKRHPNRQFQSATLQFMVIGDTVTITDRVVEAWGQEEHSKYTVQADGKEYPSEHGNGYVLMARWRGAHLLETIAKKDGQVVGQGTYGVSADGNTLTVSARNASANADGWRTDFDQVIVLDRD